MPRFIPYEKLSKKEKKRLDSARRRDWGPLRPVTRRGEDPKAYSRRRFKQESRDPE